MPKITYDITRGFVGADVARLQKLLNDELAAGLVVDGDYGGKTFDAVKRFEAANGLPETGKCAGATLTKARDRGFAAVEFDVNASNSGTAFPPQPGGLSSPSAGTTASMFGTFTFQAEPTPRDPEHIKILDDFVARNIVTITVPQLVGIPVDLRPANVVLSNGKVNCHRLAQGKILALFAAWESAGLINRILTWDGAFNARLKRGATRPTLANLSNHSFGSTFDINAGLNPQRRTPVLMGKRGCVRELVNIAARHDFFWGGFFGKVDGMHFEVARL
jgi:peptidoglycan hydrolase-like protein with peptidoglycan-binding domain